MSNSNYYAVCAADLRKLREMNAVFAHGIPLACPRVNDYRLYSVFAEPSDNIVHLTVSGIGAILLKCKTENDYLRFFGACPASIIFLTAASATKAPMLSLTIRPLSII